jgi:hypothetical protein
MVQDLLTSGGGAGTSSVCIPHRAVVPGSCLVYLSPTSGAVGIGISRLALHSDGYENNSVGSFDVSPAN